MLVEKLKLKDVAGQTITLTLTGRLKGSEPGSLGAPILGQDCVRVLRVQF